MRARTSISMVRDPVTGRLDVVTRHRAAWGDRRTCPGVVDALGRQRHDDAARMAADGGIRGPQDLHDATLVDVAGLLAPHVDPGDLAYFARSWMEAAALVRDGSHPSATVTIGIVMDDEPMRVAASIAASDIILSVLRSVDGRALAAPHIYWNEQGGFGCAELSRDDVEPWMVDADLLAHRADDTRTVAAARRKSEQARKLGVIDMFAFRTLRMTQAA